MGYAARLGVVGKEGHYGLYLFFILNLDGRIQYLHVFINKNLILITQETAAHAGISPEKRASSKLRCRFRASLVQKFSVSKPSYAAIFCKIRIFFLTKQYYISYIIRR